MSETIILNFKHPLVLQGSFVDQVREIFFEASTRKGFQNKKEKDAFFWKYVGFYLSHYPEYSWVALQNGKVLGYVLGMPFTQDPSLYAIQPHLQSFQVHFKSYPAHLHVNCHTDGRGQGVGKKLVLQLLSQLKDQKVPGLHIMTGPTSENKVFYQKLGFDFEMEINSILMMGIRI
jgi:ribosomal protein S18 acetylase RimI-like enzyme